MIEITKTIITLILFAVTPYFLFWLLISPKITRHRYALFTAFLVGLFFFLLGAMYGTFVIGLILLIFAFPGGYPVAYLLYPNLKAFIAHVDKKDDHS